MVSWSLCFSLNSECDSDGIDEDEGGNKDSLKGIYIDIYLFFTLSNIPTYNTIPHPHTSKSVLFINVSFRDCTACNKATGKLESHM